MAGDGRWDRAGLPASKLRKPTASKKSNVKKDGAKKQEDDVQRRSQVNNFYPIIGVLLRSDPPLSF